MGSQLKVYPGCPSLSWIIAERVTSEFREDNAVILITGKKGIGKSVFSTALAEDIAENIAWNVGGKANDYFNVHNIRSVDKHGSMEILTSDVLKRKHSVIIIDDAAITINARAFATTENKTLNEILTISRIYQGVLIFNCIYSSTIDKVARQLADYVIKIISSNTYTEQTLARVYFYELSDDGKVEYKKYLTWNKMRIKYWLGTLPSPKLLKEYKQLRKDNTDRHITELDKKVQQFGKTKTDRFQELHEIAELNRDRVQTLKSGGKSLRAIERETGLSWTQIQYCLKPRVQ